jgi:hypothetical protein
MALKGASTTQEQDWLDLKELAMENAAAVFTVKAIEDVADFGNGPIKPVRARIIVLTGKHAGEVYEDERILAKGVRMKLTEVSDDVVGRLTIYGTRKAVGLNAEHDGDIELAEEALAKFSGKNSAGKAKTAAATAGKAKTAAATADDDEPPF